MRTAGQAACALLVAGFLATGAPAETGGSRVLAESVVAPPRGFSEMCRDLPDMCATTSMVSGRAMSEIERARLVREVNSLVNRRVRQRSDQDVHGRVEVWRRSGIGKGAVGDCEDLALEKREILKTAGFPARDLVLAVAYRRGLGLHLVLVATIGGQDLVLDSRTSHLAEWTRAPYAWVARQSPDDPLLWHGASGSRPAETAAQDVRTATGALKRD